MRVRVIFHRSFGARKVFQKFVFLLVWRPRERRVEMVEITLLLYHLRLAK